MAQDIKIRWGWLKAMYIYTIIGGVGFGLGMIVIPNVMRSVFYWPSQVPAATSGELIVFGVAGSVYLTFGLLSILGIRSPLKFAPILFLQLCYKSMVCIFVILPLSIVGNFPNYAILYVVIFPTYIIGDLIAIPFSYVFTKESHTKLE